MVENPDAAAVCSSAGGDCPERDASRILERGGILPASGFLEADRFRRAGGAGALLLLSESRNGNHRDIR